VDFTAMKDNRSAPILWNIVQNLQLYYRLDTQEAPSPGLTGLRTVSNPLIQLLQAVEQSGSIAGAARHLGRSYRHVWGELKRWELELKQELVIWEKGHNARLSDAGERLLHDERMSQARMQPHIDSLQTQLQQTFQSAPEDWGQPPLTLHCEFDEIPTALRSTASEMASLRLNLNFMPAAHVASDLMDGRCQMGLWMAIEGSDRSSGPGADAAHWHSHPITTRWQGLMLGPGNPLGLQSLQDACHSFVRWVRPMPGSHAAQLLEHLLEKEAEAAELPPHGLTEPAPSAVAQAVLLGLADVGLGTQYTAQQAGLHFVPLVRQTCTLFHHAQLKDTAQLKALTGLLQSPSWLQVLQSLSGH
jgi:putative molybdopterin biosynthesis protein